MATIQLRRGDAAEWTDANSVLAEGEVGLELDTGKFKWGDGTTAWNDLAYIGGEDAAPGRVSASIAGTPIGTIGETPEVSFANQSFVTVTSPPLVIAPGGGLGAFGIQVFDVPDIDDVLDINVILFVTDLTGENTGLITAGFSTETPADSYTVDLTGVSPTIVGDDLTWDGASGFNSEAGGVFVALMTVQCGPD